MQVSYLKELYFFNKKKKSSKGFSRKQTLRKNFSPKFSVLHFRSFKPAAGVCSIPRWRCHVRVTRNFLPDVTSILDELCCKSPDRPFNVRRRVQPTEAELRFTFFFFFSKLLFSNQTFGRTLKWLSSKIFWIQFWRYTVFYPCFNFGFWILCVWYFEDGFAE